VCLEWVILNAQNNFEIVVVLLHVTYNTFTAKLLIIVATERVKRGLPTSVQSLL
jgi:hypothetical protein